MTNRVLNVICPDFLLTNRCNMACKYCFEKNKGTLDMDIDKLSEYMSHNPCLSTFPFGGEPCLVMNLLCAVIDNIGNNPHISSERKKKLISKSKNIITNGTLLKGSVLEKFKKYGFHAQISIDGPKHVQDMNRVFPNGKGSYDTVIKGVETCVENNINWSVHGVVNKETIPYLYDTFVWFFEIYVKYKNVKTAISHMGKNTFQIIFEQDYTDDDTDILINQFHKIADYIYSRDYLNNVQKNELFNQFFSKNGGVCSAGCTLLALDTFFNLYPCHRVALIPEKDKLCLGNVFEPLKLKNFKVLNSFYNLARLKRYMYSSVTNNNHYEDKNKDTLRWFMWCPATNWQTSGTPYYQSAKYNLMFTELNRAIVEIRKAYYIKIDGNSRRKSCEIKR